MPAIEHLLKRMGFVRLSRYGLVLTPEGRIMSLRPAVLDDGMGGRIVGWRDRDLASAELAPWEPARPAARGAVAGPVATSLRISDPVPVRGIAPLAASPAPVPARSALVPAPPPPPAVAKVAVEVEPEEDEWEWEIALARARVVAEELEAAAPPMPVSRPSRRSRLDTVPPPVMTVLPPDVSIPPKFVEAKTLPLPAVSPHDDITAEWPKTEPLGAIDYDDLTSPTVRVVQVAPPATLPARMPKATPPPALSIPQPIGRPLHAHPRAASPVTVIPIPKLPRVNAHNLQPVVRRFPKATPVTALGISPPPPVRRADDDRTSPGMLPAPAATIALPSIPAVKRR